jgi:hypothetical protein
MRRLSIYTKLIYIITVLVALVFLIKLSLPYVKLKPGIEFLSTKQFIYHLKHWKISFYIHVFISPLLLIAGLISTISIIRLRLPVFHQIAGKIYVLLVLFFAGPSGLIMSFYSNGGVLTKVSFVSLSIIWMFSTLMGYISIRKQEYKNHLIWMYRSYALTLSAITLRFYAYLFDVFNINIDPITTYTIIAFISWIPNLFIIEVIRRKL